MSKEPSPERRPEALISELLASLGEDPARPGLRDTPERVVKALRFLTSGYAMDPKEILGRASFEESHRNLVIVRDIEMYSLCEHHLLPFVGRAHVGYVPNGSIVGLSKIARVVDAFARRLQVQERLTDQIADALVEAANPSGVGVVIEASHFCMMMRGVGKQHSSTVTSALRGSLLEDLKAREEFMRLIGPRAV